jgi:alcohol/geraniol dehydrogenase (NADP+)
MIKAYAAYQPKGELKPFEYDPGPLGDYEVEIDVKYCGICHTDLAMIDNGFGYTRYPFVGGHEIVGIISSVGKNVSHLKIDDFVGVGWGAGYCMTCEACLSGNNNFCPSMRSVMLSPHGGFAERVRAGAEGVLKIPDLLDKQSAGPLFCAGITVFNPLIQYDIKPTDKVGVIGIGGLGHLALQFLKAWGCEVTAFTSSERKMTEALEFGAHHAVNSLASSEIAKSGRYDLIISTVNANLDWNAYIGALRPKGRLHIVGTVMEPMKIDILPVILSQNSISGSPAGSPATVAKMLEFAARNNIKPVIEKFNFDNINEAIQKLRTGQVYYRIVLSHE